MSEKKLLVSQYLQYVLLAAALVVLVALVRQISGVLLTFLMAMVLTYALNPLVRGMERRGMPRLVSVLTVYLALVFAAAAALLVVIVPAIRQVQALFENPRVIVEQATSFLSWIRHLPYIGERVALVDRDSVVRLVRDNLPPAGTILKGALGFIGGVFGIFGAVLNLFLMLIVSIYLALDRERVVGAALGMIPETVREQTVGLFHAVEDSLARYLRAQILLCLLMGTIGWAIVFFTGGDYALLIGAWVGFTELIPVLGAFLGAVPAVVLALLDGPIKALVVALLFLLAQQLEGNLLVPKIMGSSVGVHPLWVMFAMLSATALYGVAGALFAVPVVAIVAATARYLRGTLVFEPWSIAPVVPVSGEAGESLEEKER
ncbi:AI-2E family transporter [Rubrobacter calidifluminis]|uniref:AI-2E family transporter n=1 Tax=Rubrobacter calidifluminis TaxID=1392640 RepID=UPI00235EB792|nr:AI-2E family transporter [Rubrobacter calidifluminis]